MERSEELKEVVMRLYDALVKGDMDTMDALMSRQAGVLLLGTDPRERWTDHATFMHNFRHQTAELGGTMPLLPGDPQVYAEGTVGWAEDQARFDFGPGQVFPTRITMVWHQEDGAWKIVQMHISFGVTNEDVIGETLTT